jgi:hypothetical protein
VGECAGRWSGAVECLEHWKEGEEARGGEEAPGRAAAGGRRGEKGAAREEEEDGPDRAGPPVGG